jgi:hypothetical protein
MREVVQIILEGRNGAGAALSAGAAGIDRLKLKANDLRGSLAGALSMVTALAAGLITGFLASSIRAATESQDHWVRLGNALHGVGVDFSKVRARWETDAKAIQDSTAFGDEDVADAGRKLIEGTRNVAFAQANLRNAIDLASRAGISAEEAGQKIARAFNGKTRGLEQLGVHIKNVHDLTAELTDQLDNHATRALQSNSEKVRDLKDDFGEAQETIGSYFLPMMAQVLDSAHKNRQGIVDFGQSLLSIARFVAGVVAQAFDSLANILAGSLAMAVGIAEEGFWGLREAIAHVVLDYEKFKRLIGQGSDGDVAAAQASVARAQANRAHARERFSGGAATVGDAFSLNTYRRVNGFQPAAGDFTWGTDHGTPDPNDQGGQSARDARNDEINNLKKLASIRQLSAAQITRLGQLQADLTAQLVKGNLSLADELKLREQLAAVNEAQGANSMRAEIPSSIDTSSYGPGAISDFQKDSDSRIARQIAQAEALKATGQQISASMLAALGPVETLQEAIGGSLTGAMFTFAQAAGDAFLMFKDGAGAAFKGFAKAGLAAVGAVSKGMGDHYAAQAVADIGTGIAKHDPSQFLAAAKHFAAAALFYAVGGAASGGGRGGGGGGGGGGSTSDRAKDTTDLGGSQGEAQLVIQGGLLDMSDPRQAQAFSRAVSKLTGRRVIVSAGGA